MKSAVVVFPGSNCDRDLAVAIEQASGTKPVMLWHRETEIPAGTDLIALPGGFSYGDYLRSGAMAARSPVMDAVRAAAERGVRVVGICNGFQVLTEGGLLPGALMRNESLQFRSMNVTLKVENTQTVFTGKATKGQLLTMPIAHGDGRYTADADTIKRLEGEGQVVFRYVDAKGEAVAEANPNGATNNIAGVTNETGTVVGMMPHPERALEPLLGSSDGLVLFESLLAAVNA